MKPRRFCMVTTFYPPHSFGGDGVFVQQLSRELADRGHRVDVVYSPDAYRFFDRSPRPEVDEPRANLEIHRIESRAGRFAPLVTHQTGHPGLMRRALRRRLERERYDVIHFHNVSLMGAPSLLRYGDAVKLYTTHEYWLVCPLSTLWRFNREPCDAPRCLPCVVRAGRPPQAWRATGRMRRAARHIDAFIAPSRAMIEKHHAFGFDVPFECVPNFSSEPAETSAPPERARPYFLFVGRLEPTKGVDTLIDAFRDYPGADLLIAGRGGEEAALRRRARGLGNVEFTGFLERAALDGLYRGARAVVVPSTWFEPFGAIVLEAFARGTPVIARRIGALPEIVDRSDAGFLYETPAELVAAMNALLDDDRRRTMGAKGRAAYERHWTADVHLDAYFDVIDRVRRPAPQSLGATS